MMVPATSLTHQHLLSVLVTEADRFPNGSVVRILDAGCGDGVLMNYLMRNLRELNLPVVFELYGFDVHDHGVQPEGYLLETVKNLSRQCPDVPWEERISSISESDPWPYRDRFFDVILSNQVVEHVHNHDAFFSEI